MFYDDDPFNEVENDKIVKVYRNGDFTDFIELRIKANIKVADLAKEIESRLHLKNITKLRFFSTEGVEIFPEELEYLKNGETIFASRGEDFDRNSGLSEYDIVEKLGEGGFGEVDLAIHKKTKQKVAIKFLKANTFGNASDIDMVFAEGEMLKNLHHKNIVKILNCFTLKNMRVAFVMEYLGGGELKDYVLERGHLSEEEAKEFFRQLCDAVYYCHRDKLIHRDLKLENILLESKDSKVIKVVDFGIAGMCSNLGTDTEAGSLDYMAPEIFNGKNKNPHTGLDIWAMGVILYGMLCGTLPFSESSNKKTIERIISGNYVIPPKIDATLSREVKDLLAKMLNVDYQERISIVEIMNHPWMLDQELPPEEGHEEEEAKKDTNDKKKNPLLNKKYVSDYSGTGPKRSTGHRSASGMSPVSKHLDTPKGSVGKSNLSLHKKKSEDVLKKKA